MTPTDVDYEKACKSLAITIAELRERYDDLAKYTATLHERDHASIFRADAIATWCDPDGSKVPLQELAEQRDSARRIAVHLEQENARLTQMVEDARMYAKELIGQWSADGYGNDLLAILNGEPKDGVE